MHAHEDEQQVAEEAGYGAAEGSETPTGPPQVLPDPALQPGQPGQEQVGYPGDQTYQGAQGYQSYPAQTAYGVPGKVTTPDGQEVAGWGRRLGAWLIDSVIINIVSWIVAFPAARDYFDGGRDAGLMAARVLRGERPADMPFRPLLATRLLVNLRAAREIGLTIPPALVARADRVIGG